MFDNSSYVKHFCHAFIFGRGHVAEIEHNNETLSHLEPCQHENEAQLIKPTVILSRW